MSKFSHLKNLLAMDFSTMRALPCAGGYCAADSALRYFLQEFNRFFSQFEATYPTAEELAQYGNYIQQIAHRINTSELIYFLHYHQVHHLDPNVQNLLQAFQPSTPATIATKLLDWAASSRWGEAVRYPEFCRIVAEHIQQWATLTTAPDQMRSLRDRI